MNATNAHVSEYYYEEAVVFDFISRLWYYSKYTDNQDAIIAETLYDSHHFLVATISNNVYDITLDPVRG